MRASSLLIVLGSLVAGFNNAEAKPAPPEARKATYLISEKAHAAIDPLDARTLAGDEAFIKTLKEVLKNPNFRDADTADAFS